MPKPRRPMRSRPKNPPRNKNPRPQPTFNPTKMAKTLTGLGYDSQIAEFERALEESARQEALALSNLSDWTRQIEEFRGNAAASVSDAWKQAIAGNAASSENIANLFGESGKAEALAGMDPGADMLQALGAGDQAFMSYMQPILGQQGLDYAARARGDFAGERRELTGDLSDLQREKSQAYGKNLLDMMQLGWGREQQEFDNRMAQLQAKQAQQAIDQAATMFGPELEAQQLANAQAQQQMGLAEQEARQDQKLTKLQEQQMRIANRKAQVELQRLEANGVDPLDPQARAQVAGAALSGVVNENRVMMMNPRLALDSAMDILASMGLHTDPAAITAVLKQFEALLRFSHSRGAWKKWRMKDGKLVYAPAKKGIVGGKKTKGGAVINPKNPQIQIPGLSN